MFCTCICHIIGEKTMIQPDVLEDPLLVLLHKCDPLFHSGTFPVAQHSNCQDSVSLYLIIGHIYITSGTLPFIDV